MIVESVNFQVLHQRPKQSREWSVSSTETIDKTEVPDGRCVGLLCHAEGPHLTTDRLCGWLRQHLGGCQLYSNEEVELAIREGMLMRRNIYTSVKMGKMQQCLQELC